jgi:hypothetical protein
MCYNPLCRCPALLCLRNEYAMLFHYEPALRPVVVATSERSIETAVLPWKGPNEYELIFACQAGVMLPQMLPFRFSRRPAERRRTAEYILFERITGQADSSPSPFLRAFERITGQADSSPPPFLRAFERITGPADSSPPPFLRAFRRLEDSPHLSFVESGHHLLFQTL